MLIYGALIFWAFVSLFPIYWTITTSIKVAEDVQQGHMIPWVDFQPDWLGWRSLGLSPDTIMQHLDGARRIPVALPEQHHHLGRRLGAGGADRLARRLRAVAASSTSSLWMRNKDISFFFLSQLILPPVVLALPFLVLYKELALLDTTSA